MIIRFIVMLVALLLAGAVCASPLPVTFPQNAGGLKGGVKGRRGRSKTETPGL